MQHPPISFSVGSDHAGFALKTVLVAAISAAGHAVLDRGPTTAERVDYPDFAHAVCDDVEQGRQKFGLLVCGSGVGMSIAANRHPGIRCVLAADATTARLARAHNDANVLAIGARLIGEETARDILSAFLATSYEGGRHDLRLAKLAPV